MAKKDLLKQDDFPASSSQVLPIVTESVDYDLDDDKELANNGDLIKYEFNLIELPFFTKDKTVGDGVAKQYNFSKNKEQYMRVVPSGDPRLISNKIPQEFDEKIFYGILKLSKEQNSDVVITDYFTLAKVSGVLYKNKERITDSIQRLRRCTFELNNLFYTSENSEISRGRKEFNILQDLEEYDLKRVMSLKDAAQKELYQKYFRNSKIDCILVMTLSKRIYSNITNKAFLYFNQQDLLDIDNATARKLYLLLTKWHGWEKKNQIRRSCRFIASRLPLSWEKASITGTIYSIESSAALLKKKNLLSDFLLIKTKPIADSYIDFYFGGETNKVLEYNKRAAVTTGQENIVIDSVDDFLQDDTQATIFDVFDLEPEFQEMFNKLPDSKQTDSVKRIIEKFAHKGVEYVKSNLDYSLENSSDNFPAYLNKALSEDYTADQRQQEEIKREKERKRKEKEEAEKAAEKAENERLQNEAVKIYENMSDEEKAAFHEKLRRFPFFEQAVASFGTLEAFAVSQIAFNLKK